MTAQIPEILIHRGQSLALCGDPLYPYLRRLRRRCRPRFAWAGTSCYRGYVGTWEFRDGHLWLTALEGTFEAERGFRAVDLATAMPWAADGLRAEWVTGDLRCVEGRLVSYVHAGWMSKYERDRVFRVENGVLLEENVVLNPPDPLVYRIEPDGTRACVHGLFHPSTCDDPLEGADFVEAYRHWGRRPPAGEDEGEDAGYVLAAEFVRPRVEF